MAKKIIYEWTGEYRPPKKDEWYLCFGYPNQATHDYNVLRFILRRVEESEVDDG
jgi:hypothetical protein